MDANDWLILRPGSSKFSPDIAGTKATTLNTLLNVGLQVPSFFVLTTKAQQEFYRASSRDIDELLEALAHASVYQQRMDIQSRILEQLLHMDIPNHLVSEIALAYEAFCANEPNTWVAIRSSATIEDMTEASAAGLFSTVLGIRTEQALLGSLKKCWASIWHEPVISYCATHKIQFQDVGIALIVQHLVPATTSGIMLTVNPVSGNRNEILINATIGLGNLIADGRVTPDMVVIDKQHSNIVDIRVGDKALVSRIEDGNLKTIPMARNLATQQVLSISQIMKLRSLAIQIENHFSYPQDIEWAFVNDDLFVLQTRPISGLA